MSINQFPDPQEKFSRSAFDELLVAEQTSRVQLQFPANINADLVSTSGVGTGTVTQASGLALVSTGASAASNANLVSNRVLKYNPGEGAKMRATAVWPLGSAAGSTLLIGIGDDSDGFYFGYEGVDFGLSKVRGGVHEFIPQALWNIDTLTSTSGSFTLDPALGNVFQIQFQWLGFGPAEFFVEDPETGAFQLVHRLKYANRHQIPSIFNPTLPLRIFVQNTTNTTDLLISSSSLGGFVEGKDTEQLGIRNSSSGVSVDGPSSIGESVVLASIRVLETFAGSSNRVEVIPDFTFVNSVGGQEMLFRVVKNATLTGASFEEHSPNKSVVEVDTSLSTTLEDGNELLSIRIANDTQLLDMSLFRISLLPGDTLSVVATKVNGGGSPRLGTTLGWKELF